MTLKEKKIIEIKNLIRQSLEELNDVIDNEKTNAEYIRKKLEGVMILDDKLKELE